MDGGAAWDWGLWTPTQSSLREWLPLGPVGRKLALFPVSSGSLALSVKLCAADTLAKVEAPVLSRGAVRWPTPATWPYKAAGSLAPAPGCSARPVSSAVVAYSSWGPNIF